MIPRFIPAIAGITSALRIFCILAVYDYEAVGTYSVIYAGVNVSCIGVAFLQNQYYLYSAIAAKNKSRLYRVAEFVVLLNGLFVPILMRFVGINDYWKAILLCLIYLVYSLVEYELTSLGLIDRMLMYRVVSNTIFILSLTFINFKSYPYFSISLQYSFYLLLFIIVRFNTKYSKVRFYFTVRLIKLYIKKSNVLFGLPYAIAIFDYLLKAMILNYSGSITLGIFQILQSVENLIGQIVGGPFYKKQLAEIKKNLGLSYMAKYLKNVFIVLSLGVIVLNIIVFFDFFSIEFIKHKYLSLGVSVGLLSFFIFGRMFSLLWGSVGQYLVVCGSVYSVFTFELFLRMLPLLVFLLFKNNFIEAYVISVLMYSVPLFITIVMVDKRYV